LKIHLVLFLEQFVPTKEQQLSGNDLFVTIQQSFPEAPKLFFVFQQQYEEYF